MGEATAQIARYLNNDHANEDAMVEELADVGIVLGQIRLAFESGIAAAEKFKLDRLEGIIGKGKQSQDGDVVNHPTHYTSHPSGVECIEITKHMNFCRGNAMKYLWRAGSKGNEVEDLKKAKRYVEIEIERMTKE